MRTLELTCRAPAWFNPETRGYEACGAHVTATVDQANSRVKCPNCGAPIDVPSAAYFEDAAPPPPEAEQKAPDLEDEFQLAPEHRPPVSASAAKAMLAADLKAGAKVPQTKASPAKAPALSTPAAKAPGAKATPASNAGGTLEVGDLSGEDAAPGGPSPTIRHYDDDARWGALVREVETPAMNSRVRELMDEPDDGVDYRVAGATSAAPATTTPSRAGKDDAASGGSTSASEGFVLDDSMEEANAGATPPHPASFDLTASGRIEPADDWLSGPLPGLEPLAPAPTPAGAPVAGMLTSESRILSPIQTERVPLHKRLAVHEIPCPQCGAPMQRDVELCERCGYHLRLKRIVKSFKDPNEHVAGFEWWLKKHLHEQATVGGLKIVFWVFAPIAAAAMSVILLAMFGIFAACLLVPVGFAIMVLIAACLIPGPRGADPFNPWWALLQIQRLTGWKLLHDIPRPLNVVQISARDFDDRALDQLTELETAEVLDLEGTSVTDEGILLLRFYKGLRFLVVRGTNVSALGVRNLQFYYPELLIWR